MNRVDVGDNLFMQLNMATVNDIVKGVNESDELIIEE